MQLFSLLKVINFSCLAKKNNRIFNEPQVKAALVWERLKPQKTHQMVPSIKIYDMALTVHISQSQDAARPATSKCCYFWAVSLKMRSIPLYNFIETLKNMYLFHKRI